MVPEDLLDLFDRQVRREPLVAGNDWACVLRPPEDGDVDRALAWMGEQRGYVEWKFYAHDGPELEQRLRAAGLEPGDEETVLVAEAATIPLTELEVREATEEFLDLAHEVFGGKRQPLPEHAIAVVAVVDGRPVSGGRVDFEPGIDFAGLYGGVTLPEFRGRGLYRATVAKRAELARERGYRYLYVDALPTSRPILERVGFVAITTTTPWTFATTDPLSSSSG
jgi:GNAT superfamily N-acetyltransferase